MGCYGMLWDVMGCFGMLWVAMGSYFQYSATQHIHTFEIINENTVFFANHKDYIYSNACTGAYTYAKYFPA